MNKILSGLLAIALLVAAAGLVVIAAEKSLKDPRSWSPQTKEKEAVYASIEKALIPTVEKIQRGERLSLDEIGSYIEVLYDVSWHLRHSNLDLRINTKEVERRNKANWLGAEIRSNPTGWLRPLKTIEVLLRVVASEQMLAKAKPDLDKASPEAVAILIRELENATKLRKALEEKNPETQDRLNSIKGIVEDPAIIIEHLPSQKKLEDGIKFLKGSKPGENKKSPAHPDRHPSNLGPDESGQDQLAMALAAKPVRKGSRR